jgi:hypothetical protein
MSTFGWNQVTHGDLTKIGDDFSRGLISAEGY